MNTQDNFQDEIVLCARCAWRAFCTKKFTIDNTKPFKCPDFSLDLELLKGERKGDQEEDQREIKKGS